jgi:predicted ribosomally synthesized peptide with nif11-like leader
MSKENAFTFLRQLAKEPDLQEQFKAAKNPADLAALLQQMGKDLAPEDVAAAIAEIKAQPDIFGDLAKAVLEIFSPNHDHFPSVGWQPFSGQPNSKKY